MGTSPYGRRQPEPGTLDTAATTGSVHRVTPEPSDPTATTLTAQVSRMLCDAWRLRVDGSWTTALPAPNERGRRHTANAIDPAAACHARIHLSATPRAAATMLDRAVPLLAARGVAFTFAADLEAVRWLGSRSCDPQFAGRVLTAYLGPGEDLVELAHTLDHATNGLAGPRILSARPFRSGSLVHLDPGEWSVPNALGDHVDEITEPARARPPLLLAGRYLIGQPLRRTPSSGVYLAVDTHARTGSDPSGPPSGDGSGRDTRIVIEHARRHADIDDLGRDARTRLLHQARILRRLHDSVPVPEPLRVFAEGQDLFLVEQYLSGVSFTRWVAAHTADTPGVPVTAGLPMARRLLRMLSTVHRAGIVLRNLTPSRVLVAPDGRPMLVDLEAACPVGEVAHRVTPGSYHAPELEAASGPTEATVAEDLYSLGGLLFLMATGTDPTLPRHDDGYDRLERLATWLQAAAVHDEAARVLAPATLGLLADDPGHRCDLVTAAARLEPRHSGTLGRDQLRCPGPGRLLDDGLSYLADSLAGRGSSSSFDGSATGNRLNVREGAAGVLSVLLSDLRTGNPRHRELAETLANRLATACDAADATVAETSTRADADATGSASAGSASAGISDIEGPGLYTGRAGLAWTLADAGLVLDDRALSEQAQQLARTLPTHWPNSGVASGLAGALLTHLKLSVMTGRQEFVELAQACTDSIRRAAVITRGWPVWPLEPSPPLSGEPATADVMQVETAEYGFAHGVAGVGYALLVAGLTLSDERATALAVRTGELLCEIAAWDRQGGARWPIGPGNPRRRSHWETGASGIGTFLLRLWAASGEPAFARCAKGAADTVAGARWAASTGACHGVAGDGHFLLDAAELLPNSDYRGRAEELVALLSARHARRRGRGVVADDTGTALSLDYGSGLAGIVAYLLRLLHPGPRPFMLDQLIIRIPGARFGVENVGGLSLDSAVAGSELA